MSSAHDWINEQGSNPYYSDFPYQMIQTMRFMSSVRELLIDVRCINTLDKTIILSLLFLFFSKKSADVLLFFL